VPSSTRTTLRAALLWAMGLLLAAYAGGLVLHGLRPWPGRPPLGGPAGAAALVASTIALAHSLGLRMVTEGVETEVADSELRRLGCDQAQGYFMCRPVPAAEVEHWLANGATVEESGTPLGRSPLAVLASEELD